MIDSSGFNEAWSDHHRFLLGVAYRLLGSYSDAEDIVQEAFSRLLRSDLDPIEDVRAWLVVVVSRLCLDQLRSARVRREAYIGPWFPEPLIESADDSVDPADVVMLDDSVRMAMLIVLERMSPAERVVFVLHDIFEFPFEKVAEMVGRTPAACRQLATRARRRVKEEGANGRFKHDRGEQERIVDAFIAATATGDLATLRPCSMRLLSVGRMSAARSRRYAIPTSDRRRSAMASCISLALRPARPWSGATSTASRALSSTARARWRR